MFCQPILRDLTRTAPSEMQGRIVWRRGNWGGGVNDGGRKGEGGKAAVFLSSPFSTAPSADVSPLAPVSRPPHDLPLGLRGCQELLCIQENLYSVYSSSWHDKHQEGSRETGAALGTTIITLTARHYQRSADITWVYGPDAPITLHYTEMLLH